MFVCAELIVDWLKHAFITKFNEINAEVYKDFTTTIAYDVVRSRDEKAFSDYSDQVSRRMGFIPIPLSILLIRVLSQSISFNSRQGMILLGLAWMAVMTLKVLNGIVLLGMACKHVNKYRKLQSQTDELKRRLLMKKSKSAPSSPRISLLDFSDVLHQTTGPSNFTVSDLLAHLDDLAPTSPIVDVPPRRSQSMLNFNRPRRDKSEPPPAVLTEVEERSDECTLEPIVGGELSPKRRMPKECEDLSDVQAYTMLSPSEDTARIQQ